MEIVQYLNTYQLIWVDANCVIEKFNHERDFEENEETVTHHTRIYCRLNGHTM